MRVLILTLICLTSFACSEKSPEKIINTKKDDIPERTPDYEKIRINLSRGDHVASAMTPDGSIYLLGDRGLWINGEQVDDLDVGKTGTQVAVAANNSGSWIAAGENLIYISKNSEIKKKKLSTTFKGEALAVDINNSGNWIAAGAKGIFVNGRKIRNVNLNLNGRITANIDNNGDWIVSSDRAVWVSPREEPQP